MNNELQTIFTNFAVGGVPIPVSFLRYTGKSTTYITYQEIQDDTSFSADDELQAYVCYYDFDIYSKSNYLNILESVKEILKANPITNSIIIANKMPLTSIIFCSMSPTIINIATNGTIATALSNNIINDLIFCFLIIKSEAKNRVMSSLPLDKMLKIYYNIFYNELLCLFIP